MKRNINSDKKQYILAAGLIIFVFMFIHIFIEPFNGDAVVYREQVIEYNYNIFSILKWRWLNWSSRIVIEFVMYIMAILPSIVWKILDFIIVFCMWHILSVYTKNKIILAIYICCYPFFHMDSAGWIATTTNYLWPFTAALTAFYLLDKCIMNYDFKRYKNYKILVYLILLIYAVSNEQIVICYFLALILYGIDMELWKKCKKSKLSAGLKIYVISIIICLIGILSVLICPGNKNRKLTEILAYMPEFPDLSFLYKLRICIVDTIQHFTSVPNVIFLMLGFLVTVIIFMEKGHIHRKIIATFPFVISMVITLYYAYIKILKNHDFNYTRPEIIIEKGTCEYYKQIILLCLAILYLICILICLFWIFTSSTINTSKNYNYVLRGGGIYFVGLISRFILVFSASMLVSGTRTYFIFYIAQIWVINMLYDKINNKFIRQLCYIGGFIGIAINVLLTT